MYVCVCVFTQTRPSRTSNDSFDHQPGSMTPTSSPSMAQYKFAPTSLKSDSKGGWSPPQANGLSHNPPSEPEREEEHELEFKEPEEVPPLTNKTRAKEPSAAMALVIGEDIADTQNVSISCRNDLKLSELNIYICHLHIFLKYSMEVPSTETCSFVVCGYFCC